MSTQQLRLGVPMHAMSRTQSAGDIGSRLATMKDGTYRVTTPRFVAGFVIADGKLVACAPILAKNWLFWKKVAVRVAEAPAQAPLNPAETERKPAP